MGVSRVRIRLTHRIDERLARQSFSLLASVSIHALVIFVSLLASAPQPDQFRSTRRAAANPDTTPRPKLIWLRRADRLPAVSPGDPGPLQAERNRIRSKQARRAAPAKAEGNRQFVWSDLPKLTPQPVVQSADLVSLAAQKAAIPAPPPPRETRRFALPVAPPKQNETKLVEDPALNVSNPASPSSLNAPSIELTTSSISKPPTRAFVAPTNSPRAAASAGFVEAPDVSGVQGGSGTVNLVVLSQTPGVGLPPPGLGPRPDRVGSIPGKPGSTPGGGGNEGLTVPGVTVKGTADGTPTVATPSLPSARPMAPVPAASTTRPAILAIPATTVSVPQWPHVRRVPPEVDRMFPSKPVFAAVIAAAGGGPDLILWFSDREEIAMGTRVLMRPPALQRREGLSAGLRIEGLPPRVLIAGSISREGRFLVRSVSQEVTPELAQQLAREAARWSFSAAYRNGLPIEADCILEIKVNLKR